MYSTNNRESVAGTMLYGAVILTIMGSHQRYLKKTTKKCAIVENGLHE